MIKLLLPFFFFLAAFSPLQAQCSLAVNAQTNASLSPTTCNFTPTPSQLLAFASCPGGSFVVDAWMGGTWVANPTFNYTHVNQNFTVRVRDVVSGNYAWGYLRIEDKIAPVIICPASYTINCDQTCNYTFPAPAVSDCDASLSLITQTWTTTDAGCGPTLKTITKMYRVTDDGGNTSSCATTVTIRRQPTSVIAFPPNITMSVTGSDCTPWCGTAPNALPPSPSSNAALFAPGVPRINGVPIAVTQNPAAGCNGTCVPDCGYTVSYTDAVTAICGTNRRIDRTWQVASPCYSTVSYVQRITILTDGNASCGQVCVAPTGLNHQLITSAKVKLYWATPPSCLVNYKVQYRFKIGSVWNAWTTFTTTANNVTLVIPAGAVQGQYVVSTNCNGTSSVNSTTYSFLLPAAGGADDRLSEENATPPIADDLTQWEASIWPNPTQDEVVVDLGRSIESEGIVTIIALDGRPIATHNLPAGTQQASFNLSDQPNGMYLLRIQVGDKVQVEKVQVLK
jgi:hypothetical protein